MGILTKILSLMNIFQQILDFIKSNIKRKEKEKEVKFVQDLSKNTEKNIKEGNIEEINKNLL